MKKGKETSWLRLDNAGKLFAATSSKRDTNVFRFSCELKEVVDAKVLQESLVKTLSLFPLYQSTLKRGIFWYYLEESSILPTVKEEYKPICSHIYDKNKKNLLFKVTYYNKKINLEVHHALSDGTGAIQFLRVLLDFYLKMKHKKQYEGIPTIDYDASFTEKKADSFDDYYNREKKNKGSKTSKAYRLHGDRMKNLSVIIGRMSVSRVLEEAHDKNSSLSVFVTSLLLQSIASTMKEREKIKPVVISVPVNLRNYFESASSRNFFGVINIGYDFKNNPSDLESIINCVKKQFESELTKEKVEGRMNRMLSLEHHLLLRAIPLPLKNLFLKIGSKFSSGTTTVAFSNVSRIEMPSQYEKSISCFDVLISTGGNHICMCSYEDTLSISFSSHFMSKEIEKNFFRKLTELGMEVTIITNEEGKHEIL